MRGMRSIASRTFVIVWKDPGPVDHRRFGQVVSLRCRSCRCMPMKAKLRQTQSGGRTNASSKSLQDHSSDLQNWILLIRTSHRMQVLSLLTSSKQCSYFLSLRKSRQIASGREETRGFHILEQGTYRHSVYLGPTGSHSDYNQSTSPLESYRSYLNNFLKETTKPIFLKKALNWRYFSPSTTSSSGMLKNYDPHLKSSSLICCRSHWHD